MSVEDRALATLSRARDALAAGEERQGQQEMAAAAAAAMASEGHLVVAAGTGTGKSLAYLAAAVAAGRRTVVATATKTLQDQLADKDLPLVDEVTDRPLSWAVLKGRSNYLCLQRLDEAGGSGGQMDLDGVDDNAATSGRIPARRLEALRDWAKETTSGDRADLDEEPPQWVWSAVSVGPRECPGAGQCPRGDDCFSEAARRRAAEADVVIVNHHLYGFHLRNGGGVLPPHDVAIFDEAHEIEDVISSTTGVDLGASDFSRLARMVGGLIADEDLGEAITVSGERVFRLLVDRVGSRLRQGLPPEVADALGVARAAVMKAADAVRNVDADRSTDVATRKARVATNVGALVLDIDAFVDPAPEMVMWIGGTDESPRLYSAPLDVGQRLDALLWNPEDIGFGTGGGDGGAVDDDDPAAMLPESTVFTSATIPDGLAERLRVPADRLTVLDVGSPFDFENNALLYCAAHLPDPRSASFPDASAECLGELIGIAGGRTLALFTSYRAMNAAADALEDVLDTPVLRQGDLPRPALVEAFADDEATSLFATMGFWAGIDVPGSSLSLVTIDKIPFPRPDDPLLSARREKAAAAGFATVDLPRAATMLAQGAGRLIRGSSDRGVVAVLDPRLATKASYRWQLIGALPPMRRTKDIDDVTEFLGTADAEVDAATE